MKNPQGMVVDNVAQRFVAEVYGGRTSTDFLNCSQGLLWGRTAASAAEAGLVDTGRQEGGVP